MDFSTEKRTNVSHLGWGVRRWGFLGSARLPESTWSKGKYIRRYYEKIKKVASPKRSVLGNFSSTSK